MTDYTLDISKWRSGGLDKDENINATGTGVTCMKNHKGYMCCLGQFALQADINFEEIQKLPSLKDTYTLGDPTDLAEVVGVEYDSNFVRWLGGNQYNLTRLARNLIDINDDKELTVSERIDALKETLESEGHTLNVIESGENPVPQHKETDKLRPEDF